MNKTRIKGSAVAVTALALGMNLASAQITKSGAGYLFRAKFTKGETIRYSLVSVVPMPQQPKPIGISMPIVQKVEGVKGGIADLTVTVGPMKMNGQPMNQPQSARVKVNSQLKLIGGGAVAGTSEASFTTLPSGPIKVGGTWTSTQALGAFGGGPGGKVNMTYKLVGVKSVDGRQVAALAVSFSNPGAQKVRGAGSAHLDVATGLLRDMVLNVLASPAMSGQQGGAPMHVTVKVKRVS